MYKDFRDRHCLIPIENSAGIVFENLPLEKQVDYYAEFWRRWNLLVEEYKDSTAFKYVRIRLEDLDIEKVSYMLDLVNFEYRPEEQESVFNNLPQNIHSKGKTDSRIVADMIRDDVREKVALVSERYGYDLQSSV